jgi:CRISPR-associated protein Cas8b1/Cst1 subtype I-B
MSRKRSTIARFINKQDGAALTEYCLLLVLILFACLGLVEISGGFTQRMFSVSGTV